jgi:pimeloyl-ACP methyl ester carboxylesterase
MNLKQPDWLNKELFPFTSHWVEIEGNHLHYIDEGKGEILLFVHGTPEWSFGYRDLIKDLRHHFRCIAVDLLGFGLSDKPADGNYTCVEHATRLEKFVQKLDLKNISIAANDFGGGISLSYAVNHPDNIKGIMLFNTWLWSLRNDKHYSTPARIMNSWLGKWLYLQMNFPVNVIMPSAYGNKKLLSKEVHRHYKMALAKGSRMAAYAFSKELINASEWWQGIWEKLDRLSKKQFLIFWGMKDKFVPPYELEKWTTKLPQAQIVTFHDAGHFVQEEKPKEMIAAIRNFLL